MGLFITSLGLAFVGGVILNVMPCVLPVLTMKVFHTIDALGNAKDDSRKQAIAYTAGTIAFFIILAGIVIALRSSGESLGWGMHFRNPIFVATMVGLTFVMGLNALGVFEITVSAQGPEKSEGWLGGFLTGIFAAIMSTPCTAPFLGTAAAFAISADTPDWQTVVLFGAIGFGLAFPYTLIGFVPRLGKLLPKPGAWMETFKQVMGFSLIGMSVWLFGVLLRQITPQAGAMFAALLFLLAVGAWAIGRFAGLQHSAARRWFVRGISVAAATAFAISFVDLSPAAATQTSSTGTSGTVADGHIGWAPFDETRIASSGKDNQMVFLDFTADWCANCKTNEKLFLETETVREAFRETGALPMKVDMTNENALMDKWLAKIGRSAIPAYAIIMPSGEIDLLPVAITATLVAERLRGAKAKLDS